MIWGSHGSHSIDGWRVSGSAVGVGRPEDKFDIIKGTLCRLRTGAP
jgi:hypothetical protein